MFQLQLGVDGTLGVSSAPEGDGAVWGVSWDDSPDTNVCVPHPMASQGQQSLLKLSRKEGPGAYEVAMVV